MIKRTKLYIDGENLSHKIIEDFFINKENKKIYNNIEKAFIYFPEKSIQFISKKYAKIIKKRNIEIIPVPEYRKGKNSADIAMCIDIIEDAITKDVENYIIATNDSDFTSLFIKLKKLSKSILLLSDNYELSKSLAHYSDFIINSKVDKLRFDPNNPISFFSVIENNIKNKDSEGFFNIDQITRTAQDHYYNFSYKDMGFKKLSGFIENHKNILIIKEINKENNKEIFIKLKD